MNFRVKLLLLVLLCCPVAALAELGGNIQADFAVISGVVVMPINEEYIVDLDARDSLSIGDILTLVKPGKKIFHPETGAVIGSTDEAVGFLQVTRLFSGYSYAKSLTAGLKPENGAALKRFEQVPALFVVDTSSDRIELARQVKVNLPQFQWLEANQAEQALLTFALQDSALEIKNPQGDSLHRYSITADQQLVSTVGSAPRPYAAPKSGSKPGILQKFTTTLMGNVYQSTEERFAELDAAIIRSKQSAREGIWLSPELNGQPAGLAVADFDGDGQQETAVLLDHTLVIARIIEGEFTQLAEVSIPVSLQVLSLDALDLDGNGRAELYLSAMSNYHPSSLVIEHTGADYEIVIKSVKWLLRAVDFADEKGRVLVGQRTGNQDVVFVDEIFQVSRKGNKLVEGTALKLPDSLSLFNFVPYRDTHKKLNYARLTDGDYLKVTSPEGVELWESEDYLGGSENCFSIRKQLDSEILVPTCMKPRMVRAAGNEILVVQNDGQRMVQRYRKFKRSRVISFSWNGFALVENWSTASQNGYLADFVLADANNDGREELVMAVNFKHKGLIDQARSAIVTYDLN
jgi:hypothetical protein